MKTTLLLLACFGLTALAPAADQKDGKKPDSKSRAEKKEDQKEEKKKKEAEMRNRFEVTVEGAKDESAESDVKTFLASIEGVKLEKCEKTSKGMEAILSTATKLSRSEVAKALKDNKDLKVSDFKAVRPVREKDVKKDEKKTEDLKPEDKKPDAKKPEDPKPGDKKADAKVPEDPKPGEKKPE